MTENKYKIFLKILEFGILPIAILIIGLTIEYKTGVFQKTVDDKDSIPKIAQKMFFEKNIIPIVDSIQSTIFDEGYRLNNQKEIYHFKTDIRVYNDIIKEEILTSRKIQGGTIFNTNDTVFQKKIGSNLVEFFSTSENFYNQIVTIKDNKFYSMKTMYDEYSCSINLTILENINNEFPVDQVLIKIDNKKNNCNLIGYFHKNQKDKFLKSQKKIIEDYNDQILFWRNLLNKK